MNLLLNVQRVLDHLRRYITGMPSAKRSEITPQLFLGGQFFERGFRILKKWGITAVVNMRTSLPKKFSKELDTLHLPTVDKTAPSLDQLKMGIKFITKKINNGEKVYIHCREGEGRGPTMATAYLMSTGIQLEDAINEIKKVRTFINITPPQLKQLKKLADSYP